MRIKVEIVRYFDFEPNWLSQRMNISQDEIFRALLHEFRLANYQREDYPITLDGVALGKVNLLGEDAVAEITYNVEHVLNVDTKK